MVYTYRYESIAYCNCMLVFGVFVGVVDFVLEDVICAFA